MEMIIEGGIYRVRKHANQATVVVPESAVDGLRGLVEAGSGIGPADRAVVQIVACPASRARLRRLRKAARGPRAGGSLGSDALELVTPGPTRTRGTRPEEPRWVTEWRSRAQARLAEGTLWEVGVRYAVATDASKKTAQERAGQLAAAVGSLLGPAWQRRRRRIARALAGYAAQHGAVLTCAEIAQLAHVPHDAVVPALERAGARLVAPVPQIRSGGRGTKVLGTAAATGRKVALAAADARFHAHLVGSTGSGKSTLILNMVLADVRDRRAVVLIDPKGDLVRDVLDRLDPREAAGRLVIIDPDQDRADRPGLPPIDHAPDGEAAEIAIDHFVGICRRIWERHWGPRADDILRQGLRTQVWLRGRNLPEQAEKLVGLAGLPTLLSDKKARSPYTADLGEKDEMVLHGFWSWFDALSAGVQSQALGPVLARLRTVMGRDFVRDTIGAPEASACFDLGQAMDQAGIVLVRLPKGQLGEDTAKLLGSIVVARVWQTALERQAHSEAHRPDVGLYIDEAHNFLNLPQSINDMLAEARALGLSLTLAHQHMGQLDRELQFAISSNARNKVYFTVSPEDARLLSRHTRPNLAEHDLAHAGQYQAAARLVADGLERPAFTLATLPPPPPVAGRARQVRAQACRYRAFTNGARR
ncbi:hypothetical protein GCM10029992_37440 [Glycomyces albus]